MVSSDEPDTSDEPDNWERWSEEPDTKGATSSLPDKFVQALPNFNKRSEPHVEFLRALQTSVLQGREYWVEDKDVLKSQEGSEEIREVWKEMMGLVNFGDERRGETKLESVRDLRRRTRNPGYLRPRWTKQGFLVFGDRVYLPDINDSRLKVLVARHASPLAGVRMVDVGEVEMRRWNGCPTGDGRVDCRFDGTSRNGLGCVEVEQDRAEIETKAKVEQKMQRSRDILWAGGIVRQQSEIAGPFNHQSNTLFSLKHDKPSDRCFEDNTRIDRTSEQSRIDGEVFRLQKQYKDR